MNLRSRIAIFLFLFISLSILGIFLSNKYKLEIEEQPQKEVQGVQDLTVIPQVINFPPLEATVGVQYRYEVKINDKDTQSSAISLQLIESPVWLYENGLELYGTPEFQHIGPNKVVFEISDGENSSVETYYIVVQDAQTL